MAYRNLTGHEMVKNYLKKALFNGVLSHAYFFEGQSGVGKFEMAKEFAKAVNCQEVSGEACDACLSCRKANLGNHPDIIVIGPDGRSIKNEQVKAIQTEMHLKPYESRRKVFIIDSADTMTPQAQNSLLKVLEEPPSSCLVILVSANAAGLLPTVKSRCQKLHFDGNESGILPSANIEGLTIGKARAIDEGFRFAGDCLTGDIKSMLESSEALSKLDRGECLNNLSVILTCFRDLSVYKETKNGKFIVNHDKINDIINLECKADGKAFYRIVEALMDAIEEINRTVNQQMAVDHLILKIQEALQ
ncbi:MAG: DNA polymerase III subunit delta' [Peptostreptococcaceae bacterium]|nr:DNA polymerase III subunit delta' [Peptostreptococcaceae bacterium]